MSEWEHAGRAYAEAEEERRAIAEALAGIRAFEVARQRRFAEQIDGYVQAFLESMARAGNPGSTPYTVPVRRIWPLKGYREAEVGREWVYSSRTVPASSELAVRTDGTWNASYPSRYEPRGDARAARDFAGLAGERVGPSVVEWVLKRLTEWLRAHRVPPPT